MDLQEIARLEAAAAKRLPELSRFFDGRTVAELHDDLSFLIQYVRFRHTQELDRLIKEREELRARRDAK